MDKLENLDKEFKIYSMHIDFEHTSKFNNLYLIFSHIYRYHLPPSYLYDILYGDISRLCVIHA